MRATIALLLVTALTLPDGVLADAPSCRDSAGTEQAQRYVAQCLQVSPATHPPCNAANACDLIIDEIRRGCDLLGHDAPAFCRGDAPR